jgi:hypothetical protein
MNADAGHGGLRTKRCLRAKFHQEPPHYDQLRLILDPTDRSRSTVRISVSPSHTEP